jgi:hypothetical protein
VPSGVGMKKLGVNPHMVNPPAYNKRKIMSLHMLKNAMGSKEHCRF